jgi:hypothetical protein
VTKTEEHRTRRSRGSQFHNQRPQRSDLAISPRKETHQQHLKRACFGVPLAPLFHHHHGPEMPRWPRWRLDGFRPDAVFRKGRGTPPEWLGNVDAVILIRVQWRAFGTPRVTIPRPHQSHQHRQAEDQKPGRDLEGRQTWPADRATTADEGRASPAPPFHPAAPRAAGHTRSKANTHDACSRASCEGVVRPSVAPRPPTAPTDRRRQQKWWGTQAAQPPKGPPPLAPNGAGRMPGRWTPGGPRTRRATHISHPAAREEHQPGTNAAGMARVTGRTPHQEPQAPYPHHTASGLRSVAGGNEPRETQAPATIGRHHKAEDRGRFPTPSPAQRAP